MLFFIKIKENTRETAVINLVDIQSCNLINKTRAVSDRSSKHKEIDKIELIFKNSHKGNSEKRVEIYNTDFDNFYVTSELQFAEKWLKSIDNLLIKK